MQLFEQKVLLAAYKGHVSGKVTCTPYFDDNDIWQHGKIFWGDNWAGPINKTAYSQVYLALGRLGKSKLVRRSPARGWWKLTPKGIEHAEALRKAFQADPSMFG